MRTLQKVLGSLYWDALAVIAMIAIYGLLSGKMSWSGVFHLGYWMPPIALLAIISGQFDLLESIRTKPDPVSLKARLTDFVHWLLLIGLDVGTWMRGSASIWTFLLKLVLLAIIGWQAGLLAKRSGYVGGLISRGSVIPALSALGALGLGVTCGYFRATDHSAFGRGWTFEVIAAFVATGLVMKFIYDDVVVMRSKGTAGYPRALFLKGVFCNALVVWFWLHAMSQGGFGNGSWWLENLGLCFNVIVGNLIYLGYWQLYEHYRRADARIK
ncbi:MAG TPA: hypothetical protein VJJ22_05080 [Candidatus Paceibacterota bacterium]